MTEFVFNLSRFSFKRKGWENPLQVDISETRCAVLTGLNASGKTLVMRSLERFCDAMINPDKRKLRNLENLVKGAEIESLKVRFEYEFLDHRGGEKKFPSDGSKIPWIIIDDDLYLFEDEFAEFLNIDPKYSTYADLERVTGSVIVEFSLKSLPEKPPTEKEDGGFLLHRPGVEIRRRDGINLSISGILTNDENSIRENDCTVWDEWGPLSDLETYPLKSGLRSFGPRNEEIWKSEVRERTGLNFLDFESAILDIDERYYYDQPDQLIRFDVNLPFLHSISDAYSLTGETIEYIQEQIAFLDNAEIEIEEMMAGIFMELFEDRLNQMDRNDSDLVSRHYAGWKEPNDPTFEEATEEEITTTLSKLTDMLDLTDEEEFPLKDIKHYKILMAARGAQIPFLEDDELYDHWAEPEGYHDFIQDNFDMYSLPVPINLDTRSSPKRKSLAIEADPRIGLWLAINSFFDDIRDLRIPSSGQQRILAIFSALSEMKAGSTIMIDEPELSLHINWQEIFISTLTTSLPHLQFILATHSPHVIVNHTEAIYEVPPRDGA